MSNKARADGQPITAPYGSWKSPITSDLIVAESVGLSELRLDQAVYWIESRPHEGGRYTLVKLRDDGSQQEVTPHPLNVRTRVHEYGGGAYEVSDGTIYFVNFSDQRLYRLQPESDPYPITPKAQLRFADMCIDRERNCLFAVREDHRGSGEAVNTLVRIPFDGDATGGEVLVSGNDFYAAPRLSPDGSHLVWLTWNHPNMPWDGTELWIGTLNDDGAVYDSRKIAGGLEESISQPRWSPDGQLVFISDHSGWFNLYIWHENTTTALCPMDAEFGPPPWRFAISSYGFATADQIICIYSEAGTSRLASLDLRSGTLENIDTPFTSMSGLRVSAEQAYFLAASPTEPSSIVRLELESGNYQILRRSSDYHVDAGYISIPQCIEFPTEENLTAHAFFYSPHNQDFQGPGEERPPLMVLSHGGPTGATSATLSMKIQYWTSRGIAVVDVNYGGSTGYGRAYRQRLNGRWGIVDVDDCVNAATYLAQQGLVDGDRLMIAGGSAGGYTTLCALTFRDVFHAGASHFGVSDLEILAQHTHKFESRYLDSLVGPYPERRDLYRERSPIHFVDCLSCPLILFQGLEDKVVPPEQSEMMFNAVLAKEIPVAYVPFEGEQHGFRRAENIKRALDAELYFYSRIFGFELADPVDPASIMNLDQ